MVESYREGHELWMRYDCRRRSTEDLRQAMVHFRSLFDELLEGERVEEVHDGRRGDPLALTAGG